MSQLSIGEFSYYILTSYLQKIVCSAIKASDSALSFIGSREKDSFWFYLPTCLDRNVFSLLHLH